jgi:uncharacterized UPF0160 family protein
MNDVGASFDPVNGDFDHHQDRNSKHASAGHVWNFVRPGFAIPIREYEPL